jgi:hypothetical protein
MADKVAGVDGYGFGFGGIWLVWVAFIALLIFLFCGFGFFPY